jgi:UDP-N-acetylglucosamine--N-acetylmuramyl-(pentapeptide) pyrophosphoryl-undecaprenol N-acetylglucosamine transferase
MSTLCFVAGKSGGHIIPALTQAYRYLDSNPKGRILFFTTTSTLDTTIMQSHPTLQVHTLKLDSIRPKNVSRYPLYMIQSIRACIKAWKVLHSSKPSKIISMGGYVSIPVCIAAIVLRIPIEVYELNAIPGKTVRFLAPFATKIFTCFTQAQRYFPVRKCFLTQYPIRFDTAAVLSNRDTFYSNLGFSSTKKTIFICGGSQGSTFINSMIRSWINLSHHIYTQIQIIHQTGSAESTDSLRQFYRENTIPAYVFSFEPDLHIYYAVADIVVCRAGAGMLFEVAAFAKECITIPLELQANDHQLANARAFSENYPTRTTILRQKDLLEDKTLFGTTIARWL